ncbi:LutC/YkgG family protein [Effusibacillus pohliae]|uniref:LutC/YkgG family protein n=1 Tax=Effusibacillus pohliae TaxID=232270 RepID=UPI0003730EE7|nr:lactate utilization protein C [Effusibacillus pohliae]
MNKEQAFLERIAKRLGRTEPLRQKPERDVVGAPGFWREFRLSTGEKIGRFCESWRALTGVAEVVDSDEQAIEVLKRWVQEENLQRLVRWDHPELEKLGIDEALARDGVQVEVWSTSRVTAAKLPDRAMIQMVNEADAGITWVDYAVADTGTVCLFSSPGKARSVSLLPPIHISIFRAEQLVTRIGEVLAKLDDMNRQSALPAGVNFITGPSRSADIENDLSIGVHGPKKVYALIIRS